MKNYREKNENDGKTGKTTLIDLRKLVLDRNLAISFKGQIDEKLRESLFTPF